MQLLIFFIFGETAYFNDSKQDVPSVKYKSSEFNLSHEDIENMNDKKWNKVR